MEYLRKFARSPLSRYFALALVVIGPLLLPGFVLTMDLVFVPRMPFPQELSNTFVLELVLWLANFILPADIIEKLILLAILVLSGWGAHQMVISRKWEGVSAEFVRWGAYFAGILYMVNPFVYSRFMTGQWMVLLGYALLPFFVVALFGVLENPTRRRGLLLALWMTLIVSLSIHFAGIVMLFIAVSIVYLSINKRLSRVWQVLGVAIGAFLLMSCYWIIPSLLGGTVGKSLEQFSAEHFDAFRTSGQGIVGAFFEVIRLQGFWAEPLDLYLLPKERVPAWGLIVIPLWIIVGVGVRYARHRSLEMSVIGGASISAVILAVTPLLEWSAAIVPLIAGYREPHKFIAVLAMGFAFFGAVGVMKALQRLKGNDTKRQLVAVALLCLPILITPTMLWGFNGQLQPRQYPRGWGEVNQHLNEQQKHSEKTIFLPWHQYMSFDFSGRIIANPAPKFFDRAVLASNDPEFRRISPNVESSIHSDVQRALDGRSIDKLSSHGVGFIIISKSYDYKKYDWVVAHPDIVRKYDDSTISLYEIRRQR